MSEKNRDYLVVWNVDCWEVIDRAGRVIVTNQTYEEAVKKRRALEVTRAV